MAEWLKAAVLKTVVRKHRGFESYFLRQIQKNRLQSYEGGFFMITKNRQQEIMRTATS